MLWLGLHFPKLPLEVALAGLAEQIAGGQPRVVIDNGRVVMRNAAATAAGIAPGSTLATAHSIAPGLMHHVRHRGHEQQRLALLAEALYAFSARVCPAPVPDEPAAEGIAPGIALEIGGSLRLFGDAAELESRVHALCRELGHEVRIRRASTALAALVLARADRQVLGTVPLRHAGVEPDRLSAERIERLANMGIHTIEQLLALPSSGLARRFGSDLVDYLARLTGERPDPRPSIRPADHFRAELHLLEPLRDKEALAFPLQRLLTDLQHWLVARQLGAEQLRWHFAANVPEHAVCMPVQFTRAQQRREAFLDITRLKLAEIELPEDVIDLRLEAHRLVPWSSSSRNLFATLPADEGLEDASALVDQLRARLGSAACYSLESTDQHTPEQAWSAVSPQPRRRARPAPPPRRRPLWLFDPPRTIPRDSLTLLRGPERIHTGWWLGQTRQATQPGQARDYYVARHSNGAECWVFVDPCEQWFLHGYFA